MIKLDLTPFENELAVDLTPFENERIFVSDFESLEI